MGLSSNEMKELEAMLGDLPNDLRVLSMKDYVQHGCVSTYDHSRRVAECSLLLARRLRIRCQERKMVHAAMLHDFYLYDWHCPGKDVGLHGFTHPKFASINARKHFRVSRHERQIIESHMWPLTLFAIPRSREAWLVCMADKYCSTVETVLYRKKMRL